MKISVIGLGFVGNSIKQSLELKNASVIGYDKYKECSHNFKDCIFSDIMFLALPTQFNEDTKSYDLSCIHEVCEKLERCTYNGLVVMKSTIEPNTIDQLSVSYPSLKLIHNPEFLTAATAFDDFHNQKHIVLGKGPNVSESDIDLLETFYSTYYPDAEISRCNSLESESMKSFVNCFYAVKVQFFNELYLLCEKTGCDYNKVKDLMLKNNWINPMHTSVPGTDGKLSYGGYCFPKDTNALLNYMKREGTHCGILEATIDERNLMRNDNLNITNTNTKSENSLELNN